MTVILRKASHDNMTQSLSVITICFNNLEELQQTCSSIDKQSILPDEHLIIDGSTGNDIIHWLEETPQPPYRKWIHERDKGIADAFNKGVQRATSSVLHILNSGDQYYSSDAIKIMMAHFESDPVLMWAHSKYVQHRGSIDVISGAPFNPSLLWKGMRTVAHPTMFVKASLYKKHGVFNIDYKIAMDYDFLVRIRDEKFYFTPQPLIFFAPGGASNLHFKKGLAEVRKSYQKYIGKDFKLPLWQLRQQTLAAVMETSLGKYLFKIKNRKQISNRINF